MAPRSILTWGSRSGSAPSSASAYRAHSQQETALTLVKQSQGGEVVIVEVLEEERLAVQSQDGDAVMAENTRPVSAESRKHYDFKRCTHHLTSVRLSFLGQMLSSKVPSSEPSPSASTGISSRSLALIVRWTDDLIAVCPETSSLGWNLGGEASATGDSGALGSADGGRTS
jgi:hypothetical protein